MASSRLRLSRFLHKRECGTGPDRPVVRLHSNLVTHRFETPESIGIYVAVELKHVNNPIDDEDRGQVLDYVVAMRDLEPARCVVAALLSNLHINHVVLLRTLRPAVRSW